MDRSWWPNSPDDVSKYILANLPRPLYENRRKAKIVIKYFFPEQKYPWIIRKRSALWNEEGRSQMLVARVIQSVNNKSNRLFGSRS
jgi:hypothetical protein